MKEKFSHPRKLVRTEPEHLRTLQSSKPTDMEAPLDAPSVSMPETTDGAKPVERTARRAWRDSVFEVTDEGKRKLEEADTRITGWLAKHVEQADQDPQSESRTCQ